MSKAIICCVLALFIGIRLLAQSEAGQLVCDVKKLRVYLDDRARQSPTPGSLSLMATKPNFKGLVTQVINPGPTSNRFFSLPAMPVSPSFYARQLGWVCRQEWHFEKKTNLPLKLRLGTVEMVDYLEGKNWHR